MNINPADKFIFDREKYALVWQKNNRVFRDSSRVDLPQAIFISAFDRLTSTNTKLWSILDSGGTCPVGAIAGHQTAGKGQWGHSWVSHVGGLYLSVGLDVDLDLAYYPHLVMATAWGIASVLRHYQLPVTIKWLNDLILDCHKLGGIKIETRNQNHKLTQAVVGVGINWHNSVPAPGINLKSYYQNKQGDRISSLEELTAITTYGILWGYKYYLAVGIEQLLAKYLEICSSIGQQIDFNGCSGEVIGVTQKGKLKLKLRSPGASSVIELVPGQVSLGYEIDRGYGS
ncbi:MAG: biotin--[acetyl-CoA-carboxylase] ligase [Cyanobacteria bacterium J06623_7]